MGIANGFQRAILETVVGIITYYAVVRAIRAMNTDPIIASVAELFLTFSAIFIVAKMQFWSTDYLIGWFLGLILLSTIGIVQGSDFIFLVAPTVLILFMRLSSRKNRR
jgi:hypothetical protein